MSIRHEVVKADGMLKVICPECGAYVDTHRWLVSEYDYCFAIDEWHTCPKCGWTDKGE